MNFNFLPTLKYIIKGLILVNLNYLKWVGKISWKKKCFIFDEQEI